VSVFVLQLYCMCTACVLHVYCIGLKTGVEVHISHPSRIRLSTHHVHVCGPHCLVPCSYYNALDAPKAGVEVHIPHQSNEVS
jgi:hypothetical protein